jgi:hypothetical protein
MDNWAETLGVDSSDLLLIVPAALAPYSYSLPVSDTAAIPLAIPFFLAISAASSELVPVCPDSDILSSFLF